jgi:ribosomal protein L29|tara:strand:- start:20468 stop:20659 length:192 start_codon:yes stop_codon:yes gene_type:complete
MFINFMTEDNIKIKDLLADVVSKKKELLTLRIKRSAGTSVDVKRFKILRKEISRLLTKVNLNK